jgi:magnesium transporter
VIVDCAHYRDGHRQHDGPIELERAASICRGADDGFVWLGLFEPSEQELAQVQSQFGLHDLAIEDAQNMHLRPKLELYDQGETTFVVLRTARYLDETEEVDFGEVSVFIGRQYVLAIRQGAASELRDARARLEQRPELLAEGPNSALWAILDKVVDDYAPVVHGLERDIEELEATVFGGAVAPNERIYKLRREVTDFYRAVHPLLIPLDAIERGTQVVVSSKLRPFFRDINDHVKFAEEEIIAQREALAVMLQTNMAVISVQQNDISVRQSEISKQLTLVATVFLPLSFITGFFGMNFGWLTDNISHLWDFLVFGFGTLIVSICLLAAWFKRRGYFTHSDDRD